MSIQSSSPTVGRLVLKSISLFAFLPLICSSLTAQDKVTIQGAPPTESPTNTLPGTGAISPMVRNRSEMPMTRINPARPASMAELRTMVHRLRAANTELQAITTRAEVDLVNIGRHALEIHGLALYLKTGLGLSQTNPTSPEAKRNTVDDPLNSLISTIDRSTGELINNPASQQPRTVDAQLLSEAVSDLNELILSSSRLEQLASDRMSPKSRKALAKLHAESNRESPLLQIDLECDLWTTDSFANRPATVEKPGTMTIEKVKLDVRHHTLAREEVIPLGDCATRGRETRSDELYSAAIRDFSSYEVKGRVLFYQATYRILVTKNGKTTRAAQPLYLYYVDVGGQGNFILDTGKTPLESLPEWVKGVAFQR